MSTLEKALTNTVHRGQRRNDGNNSRHAAIRGFVVVVIIKHTAKSIFYYGIKSLGRYIRNRGINFHEGQALVYRMIEPHRLRDSYQMRWHHHRQKF